MFTATAAGENCAAPTRLTSPDPTRERKPLAGPLPPTSAASGHRSSLACDGLCQHRVTLSPGFLTSSISALARAVARAAHSPSCLLDPPVSGGPYPPLRAGPFHRIPARRLAVPPSRNGSGNAPWLAAPTEPLARSALAFRVVGTARRAGPGRIRQTTTRANRARVPSPAVRPARRPFSPSVVLAGHSPNRERP